MMVITDKTFLKNSHQTSIRNIVKISYSSGYFVYAWKIGKILSRTMLFLFDPIKLIFLPLWCNLIRLRVSKTGDFIRRPLGKAKLAEKTVSFHWQSSSSHPTHTSSRKTALEGKTCGKNCKLSSGKTRKRPLWKASGKPALEDEAGRFSKQRFGR